MQITSLTIQKQPSYAVDAGQYKGKVELADDRSSVTLNLSNKTLADIFRLIRDDASAEALRVAVATPQGIIDSEDAPELLEHKINLY